MRSCLVLGSGRGGTSLLAGMIARAGYYAGEQLYEARETNPKGFYEDQEINDINEQLLLPLFPKRRPDSRLPWRRRWLDNGQRWLAEMPKRRSVPAPSEELRRRITAQTSRHPFCFKDPRFCYTLDAWRPYIGDACFVCVFRPPLVTARSVVKEVNDVGYLASLRDRMDEERALSVWVAMYIHVLEKHRLEGDWLFIHYDQLFGLEHVARLEAFLGTRVDRDFADRSLARSRAPETTNNRKADDIYARLCDLAGYRAAGEGDPAAVESANT
jgi:hypothetical protein